MTLTSFTTLAPSRKPKSLLNGVREPYRPAVLPLALRNEYSTKPPLQPNKIDKEREKALGQRKLEPHPESVSSTSSVRGVFEKTEDASKESVDILKDVKADLVGLPRLLLFV